MKLLRLRVYRTVEFRYGFKVQTLRLALRFQTLTGSVKVHIFSCRYRVNATHKRKGLFKRSQRRATLLGQQRCTMLDENFKQV